MSLDPWIKTWFTLVKHDIYFSLKFYNKHVWLFFTVIQPANISDIKCDIPELRGDNYKVWKEKILHHLGWMDIDYVIRKDEDTDRINDKRKA